MSTAPIAFTGVSSYSSDLQSILQRAISIAQLPGKAIQNQQTTNLSKKQALVAMDPIVANLGNALSSLGSIAANQGLVASSSDASVVSVMNTGAASAGTYTISDIKSLAAAASETSLKGYSDATTAPVSTAGQNQVELRVGSNTYQFDLTGKNNLAGLRDAINSANAGVTASILTTGNGDYLTIAANNPGATTLTLNDVPSTASLITNTGTGTETALTGYPDTDTAQVSATGKLDFTVGSSTYHLDMSGNNNLTGLMNAINGSGADVTASIINNAGSNSLQIAANGGATTMSLVNVPVSLISGSNQGSDADFILNGNIHVTQPSNLINGAVPGLSFNLKDTTTGTITISVASDASQLSSALETFVQNYNAVVDQVDQQVGRSAGPLGGDMIIRDIADDMRQLGGYWANGNSVRSLSDIGISFDTTGHMSFDSNVFNSLSGSQVTDAFHFFASNSGFGALANNFKQLTDPTSGVFRVEEDGLDAENQQLSDQLNVLNDRVSQIQTAMTAQIQKAHALLAQLESEQNAVSASIQSIDYVTFGKLVNSNSGQ